MSTAHAAESVAKSHCPVLQPTRTLSNLVISSTKTDASSTYATMLLYFRSQTIAFAACDISQAKRRLKEQVKSVQLINVSKPSIKEVKTKILQDQSAAPNSLANIYRFSQRLVDARHDHPSKTLVVCSGCDQETVTRSALLLGGHLIVYFGMPLSEVEDIFSPISSSFLPMRPWDNAKEVVTVCDCWCALHRARQYAWIDFTSESTDFDRCIDMQEHIHYDSQANGALHVLVPGKLIAFPCPADLAGGEIWADNGEARQFSPAYFGDVFCDFNVEMVVRCGDAHYDTGGLEQHGISVEDLPVSGNDDADDSSDVAGMLRASDRFLTLTDLAQGAIAVHGRGDDGSLGTGGRLLVQMYLMRRHGFGGGDAVAWMLMAHPGAAGRAAEVVAVEEEAKLEPISSAGLGWKAAAGLSDWGVSGLTHGTATLDDGAATTAASITAGLAARARNNSCGGSVDCLALLASRLSSV